MKTIELPRRHHVVRRRARRRRPGQPAEPGRAGRFAGVAVRLVATSELMVDRYISRWLRTHYPGWDADPHEFKDIGIERYAVVYITSPNNPGRRVYFRIMKTRTKTTVPCLDSDNLAALRLPHAVVCPDNVGAI